VSNGEGIDPTTLVVKAESVRSKADCGKPLDPGKLEGAAFRGLLFAGGGSRLKGVKRCR